LPTQGENTKLVQSSNREEEEEEEEQYINIYIFIYPHNIIHFLEKEVKEE